MYIAVFYTKIYTKNPSLLFSSRERAAQAAGGAGAGAPGREVWKNKGSSYDLYSQDVVISMEDQEPQPGQTTEGKAPKERPVWLTESTVQGAYSDTDALKQRESQTILKVFFVVMVAY